MTSFMAPPAPSKAAKNVLVDGRELAQLMIEYDFGVTVRKTYELKAIDRDFFDEDA